MLTIFYLYKVLCSKDITSFFCTFVVNCLQFFIFTRFFAVKWKFYAKFALLWIAYNFLSLQGSLQYNGNDHFKSICCELLTIFYLYKVLCSLFLLTRRKQQLWIAYNFLSLQGSLQWLVLNSVDQFCCELLTIFYLYKVLCSVKFNFRWIACVVNCLQFFIFTRFFAVGNVWWYEIVALWIAYNFLSLQGSLQ